LEGGNDDNVGTVGKGEFNSVIRTQCSNQRDDGADLIAKAMANDGMDLIAKAMKILMASHQTQRGMMEAGRGGALDRRRRNRTVMPKRQRRGSKYFFIYICAPRERKKAGTMPSVVGAASPWFTGAGSDLLVVK
jgi:hypothetical protein